MRFSIRAPRLLPQVIYSIPARWHEGRRRCRAAAGLLALLISSGPALAENFDVAVQGSEVPFGEFSALADVGGVVLSARHREYLTYLNRAYVKDDKPENPLQRRSDFESTAAVDLASELEMPLSLGIAVEQWQSGALDLRMTGRGGLRLPGLAIDHRLTITTSFAADGQRHRSGTGQLALGFDFLGGVQEGIVEYDAAPIAQITAYRLNSDWRFGADGAALVSVGHRPLTAVSEARVGLRRTVGPFRLTTDVAADSLGAYSIGVSVTLDLGATPAPSAWRLSSMLADLRAATAPRPGFLSLNQTVAGD
ncbi:MAG: hypothetical protein RH942_19625 [Kiloniellaceae bacterium]